MKKFFKSKLNIAIISQLLVGFVLSVLGGLSIWCIIIGSAVIASGCFTLGAKFHAQYNKRLEIDEADNFFDAREYDYDEDVYMMPNQNKEKPLKKKMFSKLDALTPAVMCYVLGVVFVFMSIRMLLV